jgi:dTMP kinase
MFFVFDGVDGAGKSTQINLFLPWLESEGHEVVTCKDPGSTLLGEELRRLLLDRHQIPIAMRTEMMMFTTARTQLVDELIRPALDAGKTVVLDRYIFSTVVYQGHAGSLDPDEIWTVNRIATNGLMPDLTFLFDLEPTIAFQRLQKRTKENLDRMEVRGMEYFEKVRTGYLREAERWPNGVEIINSDRAIEEIQAEIRDLTHRYMQRH